MLLKLLCVVSHVRPNFEFSTDHCLLFNEGLRNKYISFTIGYECEKTKCIRFTIKKNNSDLSWKPILESR